MRRVTLAVLLMLPCASVGWANLTDAAHENTKMGTFAIGVASGVIAAFVGFVLKEWATSVVLGFRIRKLLVADMKDTIQGLRAHYPALEQIEANLKKDEPSFIWDNSSHPQAPDYVTNAIYYLTSLETTKSWRFYDALSRLDDIRDQYNGSVRSLITEATERELHRKIATACIHDLGRHYAEAISIGSAVFLEIKKNHWFVEIDVGQCDADMRNFSTQK